MQNPLLTSVCEKMEVKKPHNGKEFAQSEA